ncbi:MAG: hypothetical protein HC836_15990 [Richelia sp. RM2_1_2]|uniref:Uncharacterized protein n=2 Tax=Plectonema TaxID=1183 RepID=A0A8J7F2G0_9CYAN|nr:hypothetical protein [Plectonema cf. radiosum LEGE 06105]NJL81660.1 hypothetical protein [Richelia sp. SM2_1_7]NJM22049.1 hypothetical protein [Richelia sp. SM1_7_0]NJN11070.1 hypothetical protein [Richelia sp. RM1_1_1]NJO59745.1 hypothetical protein [Richelia sp. RM2_1_2]
MMYCVCDSVIDFDAHTAYKAEDIENLISQVQQLLAENKTAKPVVVLKNAHYLTTKAFAVLNNYIRNSHSTVSLVIVSSDRAKIFPPLLEFIESADVA